MVSEAMPRDAPASASPALLHAAENATRRLIDHLRNLSDHQLSTPSRLTGWSRATIAAHLWYGATASLRMTDDALAHRPTAFYPQGAAQREASLRRAGELTPDQLVSGLADASERLRARWAALAEGMWATRLREQHLGQVALTRLVALRLTEIEVHHSDLDIGYSIDDWSKTFVNICLPLRVAWLVDYQRHRPDADLTVNGRWVLRRTDAPGAWLIEARGRSADAWAIGGHNPQDAAELVEADGRALLALLLGRTTPDRPSPQRFKMAFPGP